VKFLILIYSNPKSREIWEHFPPDRRAEGLAAYAALREALEESGELIVSEALADPSLGRRLPVRDDLVMPTDGPFAEVKEHLAGFFLVECDSFERALAVAERVPEAPLGLVEVRPVLDRRGMEM
jgi:hypothetical protein